jgi:hypothetical protein
MKYQQIRAAKRPRLSLRYEAAVAQPLSNTKPAAAVIPPAELRRLVASMID